MDKVSTRAAKAQEPAAPAQAPTAPSFDVDRELTKLRQALEEAEKKLLAMRQSVEDMDSYSKCGFGEIGTVARLALLSMEKPMTAADVEMVATALTAIWDRACSTEDLIDAVATEVGGRYECQARNRRMTARLAASGATV